MFDRQSIAEERDADASPSRSILRKLLEGVGRALLAEVFAIPNSMSFFLICLQAESIHQRGRATGNIFAITNYQFSNFGIEQSWEERREL
jgi:hypothetical protein